MSLPKSRRAVFPPSRTRLCLGQKGRVFLSHTHERYHLSAQMFVKELRDFLERLFRFRSVKVVQELSVRLTLKDLKCRLNSSLAELAMDANCSAEDHAYLW